MAAQTRVAPDFYDTVRRVNYLVDRLKVRDYLEIGLGNGGTFDNVRAPRKAGVDPHPWSPAVANLSGVCLQTSDEYFSENFGNHTKFDLILMIRTFHSGMTVRTIWRQQPQAVVYFSVK